MVVAFIPIGLVLARKLKMDGLVAVSSMYLAAFAGFGSTFMAASSVQVAQNIAQLPAFWPGLAGGCFCSDHFGDHCICDALWPEGAQRQQ